MSGGSLVFAGTDFQKEQKISDSNKLLYDDFMESGRHRNIPALVQTYVDNQLETYYRLKKLGVVFQMIVQGEGSARRSHKVNPAELAYIRSDPESAGKGARRRQLPPGVPAEWLSDGTR